MTNPVHPGEILREDVMAHAHHTHYGPAARSGRRRDNACVGGDADGVRSR